jgi:hypothetical protein
LNIDPTEALVKPKPHDGAELDVGSPDTGELEPFQPTRRDAQDRGLVRLVEQLPAPVVGWCR